MTQQWNQHSFTLSHSFRFLGSLLLWRRWIGRRSRLTRRSKSRVCGCAASLLWTDVSTGVGESEMGNWSSENETVSLDVCTHLACKSRVDLMVCSGTYGGSDCCVNGKMFISHFEDLCSVIIVKIHCQISYHLEFFVFIQRLKKYLKCDKKKKRHKKKKKIILYGYVTTTGSFLPRVLSSSSSSSSRSICQALRIYHGICL